VLAPLVLTFSASLAYFAFLGDRYLTVRHAAGPLSCLSVMLVYCGQTVGWIKMPLGTEVALSPGDIVLDGDSTPPRKGAQQPLTPAATAELLHFGRLKVVKFISEAISSSIMFDCVSCCDTTCTLTRPCQSGAR